MTALPHIGDDYLEERAGYTHSQTNMSDNSVNAESNGDLPIQEHEITELISSISSASNDTDFYGSSVFDATAMSPLSPASAAALARLRSFVPPPFPIWNKLPVNRRAAVLVLLFADRRGDLRVVITMRAASLRNFSGQAAFPGGKADSITESPFEIARREAFEEIGLAVDDKKIPSPFRIEHICQMPFSMAKTEVVVRPCVAFLHSDSPTAIVEDSMIPRLDAKEVAAVFSAPFHNFLRDEDEVRTGESVPGSRKDWYTGNWITWKDGRWRMHYFSVPINNQKVTKPKERDGGQSSLAEQTEEDEDPVLRYKVWGMTARILVDAARLAYGEDPTFEHNSHFGDEDMITKWYEDGQTLEKKTTDTEVSKEELSKAGAKM